VAVLAVGVWMCLTARSSTLQLGAGFLIASASAVAIGLLVRAVIRPRVAYCAGHVEFYLRSAAPIAVPLEHVEAFFLGQGSAPLPAKVKVQMETVTLVARLSRRAEEWSHVEVHPALARWCDGYITIRGMWCEPLTAKLVETLNRRLHEVKQDSLTRNQP
jgi:hypothetical protein